MSGVNTAQAAAESLIDWWAIAGVTHAMAEAPVDWLSLGKGAGGTRQVQAPFASANATPHAVASPQSPWPETLEDYHNFLAQDATLLEASWPQPAARQSRILPAGQAAPALMVIADFPDADDFSFGQLLGGATGRLFDAMLAAIGESRDSVYLASLAVSRPAGGFLSESDSAHLAQRMRHHVALVGPRHVMLMGDRTNRALLPTGSNAAPYGLRVLNLGNGTVPAIGIDHPRVLLKTPSAKAQCWRTMQTLLEAKA